MLNKYGLPEYNLRESQQKACDQFINYILKTRDHNPSFCFNAVMRWGKCLTSLATVYNFNNNPLAQELNKTIKNVLILTFFPAVEDSWSRLFPGGCEAQEKFENFNFISLKNHNTPDPNKVNVFFSSFQEIYTGKSKKDIFYAQQYDLLILDEYHYGAYNSKAKGEIAQFNSDVNFGASDTVLHDNRLKCRYRLTLTGTPYRLFSTNGGEFTKERGNLFRFTYFDEQLDRLNNGPTSDYKRCPPLNLYSVNIKSDENTLEGKISFLFDNPTLFGKDKDVPMFTKPGSASFWLIESVHDADEIEKYINAFYPGKYNIINLYCKGKTHTDALLEVQQSLQQNKDKYSIILSYNKLTLGVTIPEVDSVVFLRDISTPELYMQAACRSKSQYSDNSKKVSYLISFNLMNDYSIFQQITQSDITEKDFLRTFPIKEVDYDPNDNSVVIHEISDSTKFLDAIASVPINQVISQSVSQHIKVVDQIPDSVMNELMSIAGIGSDDVAKNKTLNEIRDTLKDPIKCAERAGKKQGINDKLRDYRQDPITVPWQFMSNEFERQAYIKGYEIGQNSEIRPPRTKEEKDKAVAKDLIVDRIQLLVKRFIYILIADYFTEHRFIDLNNIELVPINYFAALLGFGLDEDGNYCPEHGHKTFMLLYNEGIFNQTIVDQTIVRMKNAESNNSIWAGAQTFDDFDYEDEEDIYEPDKQPEEKVEEETMTLSDTDELEDISDIIELTKDEEETENSNEESIDLIDDRVSNDIPEVNEPTKDEESTEVDETLVEHECNTAETAASTCDDSSDDSSQRYIYIAKRSSELEEEISLFEAQLNFFPIGSTMYNWTLAVLNRQKDLIRGVKIGMTNRLPEERLEELNGYLLSDQKPLLEIATYREVPNDISDKDFHEYLISKGYSRIVDDHRVEYFDILPETAIDELDKFLSSLSAPEKPIVDDLLFNKIYDLLDNNPNGLSVKQISKQIFVSRGKIREKLYEYPDVFESDCMAKYNIKGK